MTLRDQILLDADYAWFDLDGLAQEVVYTVAATGASQTIAALVTYGEAPSADRVASHFVRDGLTAIVQAADVASPAPGDTVMVDGQDWKVRRRAGNGFHWVLDCYRQPRVKVHST
jgi:hypothetical protein